MGHAGTSVGGTEKGGTCLAGPREVGQKLIRNANFLNKSQHDSGKRHLRDPALYCSPWRRTVIVIIDEFPTVNYTSYLSAQKKRVLDAKWEAPL